MVSLIEPVPVRLRLPPSIKNTFWVDSMLLLFKFILTVLFISNVSFNVTLFVRYIVSVLDDAFMASNRLS